MVDQLEEIRIGQYGAAQPVSEYPAPLCTGHLTIQARDS
jgi:hypothetical protein